MQTVRIYIECEDEFALEEVLEYFELVGDVEEDYRDGSCLVSIPEDEYDYLADDFDMSEKVLEYHVQ